VRRAPVTSEPDPLTPPSATDVRSILAWGNLRRRFLRVAFLALAAISAVGFFDRAPPAWAQALRGAALAIGLTGLWYLRRHEGGVWFARWTSIALAAAVLAQSLVRLPEGWPAPLSFMPLIVLLGIPVGGIGLASALAAASLGAILLAYHLGLAPPPPFLGVQVTNWLTALLLPWILFRRGAAFVASGAEELAAAGAVLEEARRQAAQLAEALAGRVATAVARLDRALGEGPAAIAAAAHDVARSLRESRDAVPPAPPLPASSVAEQIEPVRLRAMDWALALCGGAFAAQALRNAWTGPRENLPAVLLGLAASLLAAALRWRRGGWQARLFPAYMVTVVGIATYLVWSWIVRAPISPPNLPVALAAGLVAGALIGPRWGFAAQGTTAVTALVALHAHPGITWIPVVNLAVAYGVAGWIAWRWPRELLETLEAQRDAASAEIDRRRRLLVTLFHDLASPLQVVRSTLVTQPADVPDPADLAAARDLVRRMEESLRTALRGRLAPRVLEAGPLLDEVGALLGPRLREKRLALRVAGPRSAQLRADEPVLRDSVLANLLSNALKFSPDGAAIEIAIRPEPGTVVVLVEDRGPGLPPEVRAAFDRGTAAPSHPGSRGEPGSGYGLLLARSYAEAMGGSLELLPRAGGGLSARLTLPAAP
jgi:signal transduction histidine kinase